ncbi:sulfurtransferase TusA family protein [Demequina mangrovi]|uniref:tRNA 2-thiouridine synthesizing protein A n=1 Tax=Demequina mangrovi TaxID=1043493 RepID=A0A1H6UD19_9MICO|nr:sulfurtransferase TusA family protein [Demequina mangrovi]SEI90303.1 tRNA 2-thiouridine synthesizing protein A [Demequina mangrovi]
MSADQAAAADASDVTVDATGLLCPLPIIELAKAAKGLPAGTAITVLCTDLAARIDVPAWARMTGHEFVGESRTDGEGVALTVRLR